MSPQPPRAIRPATKTIRGVPLRAVFLLSSLLLSLAPGAAKAQWVNGQVAEGVLGQTDYASSSYGISASALNQPEAVAIDPVSGKVFVADASNSRVLRFSSAAAMSVGAAAEAVLGQTEFDTQFPSSTASGMHDPSGVAVDASGTLWVADRGSSRVLRFDNAAGKSSGAAADGVLGQPNFTSNDYVTTSSGMNYPEGVAVDASGTLWVADTLNRRVLRFDNAAGKSNGAAADGVLGQPDFTSSDYASPTASVMDDPGGVVVDASGTLWVADGWNKRVLRFDNAAGKSNGAAADGVLGKPDFTSSAHATTASAMGIPGGVAVDTSGALWVADGWNNRVLRFDNAAGKSNGAAADIVLGQPDFTLVNYATSASEMDSPVGVAVDASGNLWVAENENERVLYFSPGGSSASPPTVTTGLVGSVTANSAIVDGEVTDDGGATVVEHGAVFDTDPAPTTDSGTKVVFGNGTGGFDGNLTGLSPSTNYYVRAYAIGNGGTSYGMEVNFTTGAPVSVPPAATPPAATNVLKAALTKKYEKLKKKLKKTKDSSKKKKLKKQLKAFKKKINAL